ncbi:MAG: tetratricopeptide repeat protein, partial [Planctomycetota bacterium]
DPVALETLAASYAALGKFDKAIRWQQQAIEWTNDPEAVEQRKERLELFESGKPVQDSPPSEAIKS